MFKIQQLSVVMGLSVVCSLVGMDGEVDPIQDGTDDSRVIQLETQDDTQDDRHISLTVWDGTGELPVHDEPAPKAHAVSWGDALWQGAKKRMEDRVKAGISFKKIDQLKTKTIKGTKWKFFAVFDGFGGSSVSTRAHQELLPMIFTELSKEGVAAKDAFILAFEKFGQLIDRTAHDGSTATVVGINDNTAYIAHIGDSRALVVENDQVVASTSDHRPDPGVNKAEYDRCVDAGVTPQPDFEPTVEDGCYRLPRRDNGELGVNLSRGFASAVRYDTQRVLISTPEVREVEWKNGNYIVVASDGVWTVCANEQVAQAVHNLMEVPTDLLVPRRPTEHRLVAWVNRMVGTTIMPRVQPITEDGSTSRMSHIAYALCDWVKGRWVGTADNVSLVVIYAGELPAPTMNFIRRCSCMGLRVGTFLKALGRTVHKCCRPAIQSDEDVELLGVEVS